VRLWKFTQKCRPESAKSQDHNNNPAINAKPLSAVVDPVLGCSSLGGRWCKKHGNEVSWGRALVLASASSTLAWPKPDRNESARDLTEASEVPDVSPARIGVIKLASGGHRISRSEAQPLASLQPVWVQPGVEARGYDLMAVDRIRETIERIQRLHHEQSQAIQDAARLGMTARTARECEFRRERMSVLLRRLRRFHKQPHIDATPHCVPSKPSDLPNKTRPSSEP
jgi:hypothetical protein